MIKVEVLKTIDEVEKEQINSLSNDGFFTYEWFKTVEISKPLKIIPKYIAIYEEEKIIAFAPCFIEFTAQYFTFEDKFPLIKILRKISNHFGFSLALSLVCYSPCSFHSGVLIKKSYNQKRILYLISKKIDEICNKEKILFSSFLYVSEFDELLTNHIKNFGYFNDPLMQTMYLDVKWSTFDDYLGSLESKIRKTVRREINKNIDCGVIIEQRKDFESISLLLSEFHSNLFYKYNNKISPFHPLFYEKLSEYMKEKVWLFIALKENKIVGFSLLLRHGKILDVFIAGFDYDHQTKTDFTYFNLIYYIPIRAAIEEGIEKIHFRGGAKNIKLRRGCKEENIEMFVKCHNRLLKFIPKWYIQIKNKYRFVRFIISKLKNILRKLKIISNFHRS